MFSYEGKRALVTGAGRGIGRSIAIDMARQGAQVCIASRSMDQLSSVAEEIHGLDRDVWQLSIDLSSAAAGQEVVSWAIEQMNGLEVLVNNAGGGSSIAGGVGPLEDATEAAMRAIYGLNLEAPFFACLKAIDHMKSSGGGAILNITSVDALVGVPGEALYGSAKAALTSLTESLGIELGRYGIRVNAIAPGLIDTELVGRHLKTDAQRTDRASYYPINRIGLPTDISAAAIYLCSDEAAWVSGVTVPVSGGLHKTTGALFRWVRNHNPVPAGSRL